MRRIDLKAVLERTVSGVYGDLVTRPTGKAVRTGVVEQLADADGDVVVAIDFSTVRILDISCADEIVGKLLIEYGEALCFVLLGVTDAQCHAIEQVLERHQLAVVARDREGCVQVLGPVAESARVAFSVLRESGPVGADELASQLSWTVDTTRQALDELLMLRLVQVSANRYATLTA